jgi:hypothetical protein
VRESAEENARARPNLPVVTWHHNLSRTGDLVHALYAQIPSRHGSLESLVAVLELLSSVFGTAQRSISPLQKLKDKTHFPAKAGSEFSRVSRCSFDATAKIKRKSRKTSKEHLETHRDGNPRPSALISVALFY